MNIGNMLMQYKDDILELKDLGYRNKDIAQIYNTSNSSICRFVSQFKESPNTIKDDIDDIINDFINGESITSIARKYHHSEKTISKELKKRNINITHVKRRYTLKEDYFDNVDTHRKAYILGLLYADGTINVNKHYISISLQESDVGVLDRINEEFCSNRPLYFNQLNKKNKNHKNTYSLNINSVHFTNMLLSKGLLPNKDFTLQFPNKSIINDQFMSSFLLGMSDGDGSIIKNEPRFNLTGNKDFIEGMKDYVEPLLGVHCSVSLCHNKESNTRNLRISGGRQVKKFLDYIYKDSDLYIERKHDIYLNKYVAPFVA